MKKSREPLYYSEYLQLEKILSSQLPKSVEENNPAHDETLFIIIHQAYELWFKQILHEIDSIIDMFKNDYVNEEYLGVIITRLRRITLVQKVMIEQFNIMETMTPLDFLDFRDLLVPASGFQSVQFRMIENKLGLQKDERLKYNRSVYSQALSQEHQETVKKSEDEISLFNLLEKWLERTPFLNFQGFNFLETYKETVEKMLNNDESIIRSNPTLTEEEIGKQINELEKTRENFSALFDEDKHNLLVKTGQRRLSLKATHAALFINLYRDQPILHLPYNLLSYLLSIDELFSTWRYRHAMMVHRMIGTKIGTGGSSGYNYL
ncbi:MAG: tryptophan 2,3-dioxygenase, partial [Candidatus Sericytochromatia bacterium]|nr:tryptophan 2,3-dioxygenase [Candidatus Sericytochromatia bacterium]